MAGWLPMRRPLKAVNQGSIRRVLRCMWRGYVSPSIVACSHASTANINLASIQVRYERGQDITIPPRNSRDLAFRLVKSIISYHVASYFEADGHPDDQYVCAARYGESRLAEPCFSNTAANLCVVFLFLTLERGNARSNLLLPKTVQSHQQQPDLSRWTTTTSRNQASWARTVPINPTPRRRRRQQQQDQQRGLHQNLPGR